MDKILLVISGGIAAYKSLELIRLFKKAGKEIKCVATESAMTFITSASVEYLSGNSLRTSLESLPFPCIDRSDTFKRTDQ